jgi:hypothetical protein
MSMTSSFHRSKNLQFRSVVFSTTTKKIAETNPPSLFFLCETLSTSTPFPFPPSPLPSPSPLFSKEYAQFAHPTVVINY